mmetsp:Transcript_45097/g.95865  ORF Transcript_45097/g.95865 Transcript_45097/m.95865 type:complete len:258 (+) Transcript_45097:477-1250(+)
MMTRLPSSQLPAASRSGTPQTASARPAARPRSPPATAPFARAAAAAHATALVWTTPSSCSSPTGRDAASLAARARGQRGGTRPCRASSTSARRSRSASCVRCARSRVWLSTERPSGTSLPTRGSSRARSWLASSLRPIMWSSATAMTSLRMCAGSLVRRLPRASRLLPRRLSSTSRPRCRWHTRSFSSGCARRSERGAAGRISEQGEIFAVVGLSSRRQLKPVHRFDSSLLSLVAEKWDGWWPPRLRALGQSARAQE